jgi:hypothetical protein
MIKILLKLKGDTAPFKIANVLADEKLPDLSWKPDCKVNRYYDDGKNSECIMYGEIMLADTKEGTTAKTAKNVYKLSIMSKVANDTKSLESCYSFMTYGESKVFYTSSQVLK